MPTAKAQYDHYGDLKSRKFTEAQWDELHKRVRGELRPLYGHNVDDDPSFWHPADEWASCLLEVAHTEVSMTLWLHQRLTNEQLRAEQADILKALEKSHAALTGFSYDLHNLLDSEVDVLECRDKIGSLIPHIKALREKIIALKHARKLSEARHMAALRMTVQVVRLLEGNGIKAMATADKDRQYISRAVKILKVLGDALKLTLDETTWRDLIIESRPMIAVQQSSEAPPPGGA